mmetsp:Transcript_57624/g.68784  ORF Transcript_57624/g.68784 Transcript_57624/m.68784 type:complete len:200 (-) Transcript_57624:281-880(-)
MAFEDELSHLPPKTIAPAVQLTQATRQFIVVSWPQVTRNSCNEELVNGGDVEYRLMVRGGFVDYREGMEVLVQLERNGVIVPIEYCPPKRATIVKKHSSFPFDVKYENSSHCNDTDDKKSSIEQQVKRRRITPFQLDWNADKGRTQYTFEVTPLHILEQDPSIIVSANFVLYTIGTEVPLTEPSHISTVRTFSTVAGDD